MILQGNIFFSQYVPLTDQILLVLLSEILGNMCITNICFQNYDKF